MKKIKNIVSLGMIFFVSALCTQDENICEASVTIYNVKKVIDTKKNLTKLTFEKELFIRYGTTASCEYYTGSYSHYTDVSIQSLYIDAFDFGAQSIVNNLLDDDYRIFFIKDKNYNKATIKFMVDYDHSMYRKAHGKVMLDTRALLHAVQGALFIQNECNSIIQKTASVVNNKGFVDVFLQGYMDGANAVLDFVSSGQLGVVNYNFLMEDKK